MKRPKTVKPFLIDPIVCAALVGTRAAGQAEALARARRVADRHRVAVAVWRESPGGARLDLVKLVQPRRPRNKPRPAGRTRPPAA